MEYVVTTQSNIIIDAKTSKEAINQVEEILENARKRNCGEIEDEILSNATIIKEILTSSNP